MKTGKILTIVAAFAMALISLKATAQENPEAREKANLQQRNKAAEWVASLELNNQEKENRLVDVISTHLIAVRDWHNDHPYTLIPEGINPTNGGKLSNMDRSLIINSTKPASIHENLMNGLRADLTEDQVEAVLDKYTVGKVAFTMKAYREIVPDLTQEEDQTILNYLKEAREIAVDYKNMNQISAIFEIYKTKSELFIYQTGRNWKQIYRDYVQSLKKK